MYKRYEIPILIIVLFVLSLVLRSLFFFTFQANYKVGQEIELNHTFYKQPQKNEFQQYFYAENILITLALFPRYEYGDRVVLKGTLEAISSTYENSLSEKLILKNPEVKIVENRGLAVLRSIRQKILLAYKSALPPREYGLLSGIVIGVEDGIDSEFKDELKRSGMLHVVVASGSNVVLIGGIIFLLISGYVKKKFALIFTVLGIFLYALLAGFDPPIVRASIMASFAFGALLLGRQKIALFSLFLSGWVMLMVDPKLIFNVSFQLSFSASLGIILFQRILVSLSKLIPTFLREDFATTLAAQIGALPFLLVVFGEVNLLSIFINVVLLWTVPIIMIFGLIAGMLGLVSEVLASPVLYLIYPLLLFFSKTVEIASNLYIPLSLNSIFAPIAVIYYVFLVYIILKRR